MPSVTAFREGFNLENELKLGKYEFEKPHIGHETIKTYDTYHFPVSFQLKTSIQTDDREIRKVLKSIKDYFCDLGHKEIDSDYGNPYDCYFDKDSFEYKDNSFKCLGIGIRDREKKKGNEQKKRTKKEEDAVKEKIVKAKKKGYRVVKSHFSTGICSVCNKKIDAKTNIAHDESQGDRKWMHLDCLFTNKKSRVSME